MPALAQYSLPLTRLKDLFQRLSQAVDQVIAPTRVPPGDVFYDVVRGPEDLALDFGNSLVSPVAWLYRPVEEMFRVLPGEPPRVEPCGEEGRRLLFAVRPCDLAAIERLDQFFLEGDFRDDLYAARRARTLLVGLACATQADPRCFCSCCETGPYAEQGFDLQLSLVGDRYLLEVGSESGAALAGECRDLLEEAPEGLAEERAQQVQEFYADLEQKANMPAAVRRLSSEAVPAELWDRIASRCVGCGGCSFVCPVCTCFYTTDQVREDGTIVRVRAWDSCRLEGYTREASGHNPRVQRRQRAERFSYHKLAYPCIQREGRLGCVGCGRCVTVCFGGVHMPRVAQMIRRGE